MLSYRQYGRKGNEMKDYYETKKKRYELILSAFDDRAAVLIKQTANTTFDIEKIREHAEELCETRALITDEIKYLENAIAKWEEEAK